LSSPSMRLALPPARMTAVMSSRFRDAGDVIRASTGQYGMQ
jgi:hypothetical protein